MHNIKAKIIAEAANSVLDDVEIEVTKEQVQHVVDPLSGWDATVSMWRDVFKLIYAGGDAANLAKLPKTLPVHLIGGAEDPATDKGEAVTWLKDELVIPSQEMEAGRESPALSSTVREAEPCR